MPRIYPVILISCLYTAEIRAPALECHRRSGDAAVILASTCRPRRPAHTKRRAGHCGVRTFLPRAGARCSKYQATYTHTWYTRPRPARQHLSPIAELTISLCSYRRHVGRGGLAHEGESRSLSRAHVSCSSWCLLLWMPANLHFGSVYT